MKTIDPPTLNDLHSPANGTLLDVLPEETFEERPVPGAANACVYEID